MHHYRSSPLYIWDNGWSLSHSFSEGSGIVMWWAINDTMIAINVWVRWHWTGALDDIINLHWHNHSPLTLPLSIDIPCWLPLPSQYIYCTSELNSPEKSHLFHTTRPILWHINHNGLKPTLKYINVLRYHSTIPRAIVLKWTCFFFPSLFWWASTCG